MIHAIQQYGQLLMLILRQGTFRQRGENFNQSRAEALTDLREFVPDTLSRATAFSGGTTNTFIGQLAFIKNSFTLKGGHLTAENLSYVRIPKSANTSMSMAMLEKLYPTIKQKTIDSTQINYLTDVNLHFKKENRKNHSYFTIVRNPFSRLVSVYRDFFEHSDATFIYRDYLFGVLHRQLSFAEFVDRIACIPDRLKDQHIKPQHAFLKYYVKEKIPVKTFKLEEVETLREFLNAYSLQLPHLNKSAESYDFSKYYTPPLLKKVHQLYRTDIEKFEYEQEYQNLLSQVKDS